MWLENGVQIDVFAMISTRQRGDDMDDASVTFSGATADHPWKVPGVAGLDVGERTIGFGVPPVLCLPASQRTFTCSNSSI